MKLNCQEGDLAIIVKDDGKHENLGLIVRVVSKYGMKKFYSYSQRRQTWNKRPRRLFAWTVEVLSEYGTLTYEDSFGTLYGYRCGEIPDSYLRRLPKLREEDSLDEETLAVTKNKVTA
jgi:hypothetical protein